MIGAALETDEGVSQAGAGSGRRRLRGKSGARRRILTTVAAFAVLLALAIGALVSWSFSSELVAPEDFSAPAKLTVLSVSNDKIELTRSEAASRPGIYGIVWRGGHAVIGGVLSTDGGTVTRALSSVRGKLAPGIGVDVDDVYLGNPTTALGLPFSEVRIPGQLGAMPAWLVPGRGRTWAIVVHGLDGDREGDLALLPPLHRSGLPTLMITYREDKGAPASPDGLHHMGLTEWRDLQAAARYALTHGAQRLLLLGVSMGGAIVTQFMEDSSLASRVSGLVLDSPALSWKAILSFNAKQIGLPSFAALPVEWAIDVRIKPDWKAADALDHTASFHLPILLFHGTVDKLVPISTSRAFARELPQWVTFYEVPDAGHFESWNVGPDLYDRRLEAFVAHIDPADTTTRPLTARR